MPRPCAWNWLKVSLVAFIAYVGHADTLSSSDLQLCLSSHKQLLFGVDWAPMLPGDEYAEANQCQPFNNQSTSYIPHALRPRSHHFCHRFWTSLTTWGWPQVVRQHCTSKLSNSSKICIALQPASPASPVCCQVYGEDPEFFSPYMFFSRPRDREVRSARSTRQWHVELLINYESTGDKLLVNMISFDFLVKNYEVLNYECL